ncbi:hypothetical protein D3C83_273740 [compost metagenome]
MSPSPSSSLALSVPVNGVSSVAEILAAVATGTHGNTSSVDSTIDPFAPCVPAP